MSAYPALDSPGMGGKDVRVTGMGGTGEDEDMEKFESAFPDLSGEVDYQAVGGNTFISLLQTMFSFYSSIERHRREMLICIM